MKIDARKLKTDAFSNQDPKSRSQIKIPNQETAQVIQDARDGKNMTKISLDDLKKEIGA